MVNDFYCGEKLGNLMAAYQGREYLLCGTARHGEASMCACVTCGERLTEELHLWPSLP
jgi:hypothetical protein